MQGPTRLGVSPNLVLLLSLPWYGTGLVFTSNMGRTWAHGGKVTHSMKTECETTEPSRIAAVLKFAVFLSSL